MPPHVKCLQ